MMDDTTLGRLVRSYSDNETRILDLRKSITNKAHDLSNLSQNLLGDPQVINVLGDDNGLYLEMGAVVSCDTLKELANELRELQEFTHKHETMKEQLARMNLSFTTRAS